MSNQKEPQINSGTRVFKIPIITPLSVLMVIVIYVGYTLFQGQTENIKIFDVLRGISFQLFIFCEIGLVTLVVYNKLQLEAYLVKYQAITSLDSLEALKKIARTNMYSSLFTLFFLGLGSLTAIMTISNYNFITGVIVAALAIFASILMQWYNPAEQKIRNIACDNEALEDELNSVLQCWIHKPFPTF